MLGQRFREILYFWWHNLGPLFLVTAPFALMGEAVQWLFGVTLALPETADGALEVSGISLALVLLMRPLAEGTVISQIAAARTGKPAGLVACMAPALLMFPVVFDDGSRSDVGTAPNEVEDVAQKPDAGLR